MSTRLFADCGATKCAWAIVEGDAMPVYSESMGLNPNLLELDEVYEKLYAVYVEKKWEKLDPKSVHFFGAGCGSDHGRRAIESALGRLFPRAEIEVRNDIQGTAVGLKEADPIIACILGTGSASVYFDGEACRKLRASLGWTIGDEGSGCAIGSIVLRSVFYELWPSEILEGFKKEYPGFDVEKYLSSIRGNSYPNRFIASFAKFASAYLHIEPVYKEIKEELRRFVQWQVAPYCKEFGCKASFSGSVAFHYSAILGELAREEGFEIEKIIAKPLPEIVRSYKISIEKKGG